MYQHCQKKKARDRQESHDLLNQSRCMFMLAGQWFSFLVTFQKDKPLTCQHEVENMKDRQGKVQHTVRTERRKDHSAGAEGVPCQGYNVVPPRVSEVRAVFAAHLEIQHVCRARQERHCCTHPLPRHCCVFLTLLSGTLCVRRAISGILNSRR